MTLGDALGAHVEFRPRDYLIANPVIDLESGGTWGLSKGQFDTNGGTNMDTCHQPGTALILVVQLINIPLDQLDFLSDQNLLENFDTFCSNEGVAGNGALMRLAPVPLFFQRDSKTAVEYSGISGQITHGDQKAYDACRYYGALIVAAVRGVPKFQLLSNEFYKDRMDWFNGKPLHKDIENIAKGSYKRKNGYEDGIRGKGYIVSALEAALWAFWIDEDSFEKGVLAAVNLGDDTDTTAAIYGQLAGACYGYNSLPEKWLKAVYANCDLQRAKEWMPADVSRWIRSLGEPFPKYAAIFIRKAVSGSSLLTVIDNKTLESYGVEDDQDRRKIVEYIKTLKSSSAQGVTSSNSGHDIVHNERYRNALYPFNTTGPADIRIQAAPLHYQS
ncbi:unnamed protein product [Rotaria sp. Silwood2]|nr:unnamed protein product [Rotaria sp. Silwood2]